MGFLPYNRLGASYIEISEDEDMGYCVGPAPGQKHDEDWLSENVCHCGICQGYTKVVNGIDCGGVIVFGALLIFLFIVLFSETGPTVMPAPSPELQKFEVK